MYVQGWGNLVVTDTGGMPGYYDIDIYLDSEDACWEFGRQVREIFVVG